MMKPDSLSRRSDRPTPAAEKLLAVASLIFFVSFVKFKPYEHTGGIAHSFMEQLFYLYFFLCNQTIGIIHEAGHGICYLLGTPEFVTAAAGTVAQLLLPAYIAYHYRRRNRPFGYLIGLFFLGFSLQYTAWYIGTSNQGAYVSAANSFLGVDGYHDFHFILSRLGLLQAYDTLSAITRLTAYVLMLYALFRMTVIAFFLSKSADGPARKRA